MSISSANLVSLSLVSLDWPRLVEHLAVRAHTARGYNRCISISFSATVLEARREMAEAGEMMALLREEAVPLGGITDVGDLLGRARRGDTLSGRELLEIAATAESLLRLRRHLLARVDRAPLLARLAEPLPQLSDLAVLLRDSFDARGELSVSAYPQLAQLRTAKARLHGEIARRLEELVRQEEWADILQDDFTTVRGDRYVLPVKAQAKNLDLGIVHDSSASGQTVYIEPKEVLSLNNRLVMADAELRHEERRILSSLSQSVGRQAVPLEEGLESAAGLDFIQARGRLGLDLSATLPEIVEAPRLDLRAARHPLLMLRGVEVVPNRITLGSPHLALILTGPNTGGKTVTLKTIGLLTLMARAGLPLPAAEGTVVGFFPQVLTDIGDAQSVEADLSTFSGHLTTLRAMFASLSAAPGPALVLLDEIAVGTDPRQGAALGRAVLEDLLSRGCLLATTTHYTELKALASVDERFQNGRMEYDGDGLRPTFRLTVGHPGRSYALDIARHLNLPEAVVARAESLVESQEKELETLLATQEKEAARARQEAERAREARIRIEAEVRELARQRSQLLERERHLREELAQQFGQEVQGFREEMRGMIRQLQKAPSLAGVEEVRRKLLQESSALADKLRPGAGPEAALSQELDWSQARTGDRVFLASLAKVAVLTDLPDASGKAGVQVGSTRLRVSVADVRVAGAAAENSSKRPRLSPPSSKREEAAPDPSDTIRTQGNTLDLRGKRVDEALSSLGAYLDQAMLAGRDVVFLLHGYGTLALRNALWEALRSSPHASGFSAATPDQGGDAFTVVQLR